MTLNLMARFGVPVEREGWRWLLVPASRGYASPGRLAVEGDASSASYFLAAGAIGGGPVRVEGVGRDSIQGDVRFADTLAAMGAVVTHGDDWIEVHGEKPLRAIDADFNRMPDAAMTAAIAALFADGTSRLRNIGSWRVKETDRIAAMATELSKLGAYVDTGTDWLSITPEKLSSRSIPMMTTGWRWLRSSRRQRAGDQRSRLRGEDLSGFSIPGKNPVVSVPVIAIDGPWPPAKAPSRGVADALEFI
jgi:3-phosphoshikimate 1-carboxyvinyltransferase